MTYSQGTLVDRRYRLVETIGRGGMGMVWSARDERLGRDVAVKELTLPVQLKPEERRTLIRRMRREARSAARLKHPGIVTVHDIVEHDDRPWIVMELVSGRSLEELIEAQGSVPPLQAAEIGVQVLAALRTAHDAGITHRDVKPANVLLEGDRVVLTDFGIAALDGDIKLTQSGLLMGTPAYMSPEQAEGRPATAKSDLWSLGATLYAAVEGKPPYTATHPGAVLVAIVTREPAPPRNAGPLKEVLDRLLCKDPDERATADQASSLLSAVVTDHTEAIRNGVESDSSDVTPFSPIWRADPSAAGATEMEALSGSYVEKHPPRSRWSARWALFVAAGALAGLSLAAFLLWPVKKVSSPWLHGAVYASIQLRGLHAAQVNTVAFSPDGKTLATGGDDSHVGLWNARTGRQLGSGLQPRHSGPVSSVAFSPDGRTLASASRDNSVRLWNVATRTHKGDLISGHTNSVNAVAFSPDGKTLATGSHDHTLRLWSPDSRMRVGDPIFPSSQYENVYIFSVAFAPPKGEIIASGTDDDRTVHISDTANRTTTDLQPRHGNPVLAVAFSPDGKTLASASSDNSVRLWNVATRTHKGDLFPRSLNAVASLAFSPDGRVLATADSEGVRLWDVVERTKIGALPDPGPARAVAFSPDGETLAAGLGDGTVRLWRVAS